MANAHRRRRRGVIEPKPFISHCLVTETIFVQECIPVGCVPPACYCTAGGGLPGQRPPWTPLGQRTPWTETPLDRDYPPDRDHPGQTPSLDRDPPGQRPPPWITETTPLDNRDPLPPWTDKHLRKHNLRKLRLRAVKIHQCIVIISVPIAIFGFLPVLHYQVSRMRTARLLLYGGRGGGSPWTEIATRLSRHSYVHGRKTNSWVRSSPPLPVRYALVYICMFL